MKEGLKCAAVFIGTVIGAGFATGQEVLLYFGRSSIAVPIFSGILLGLFNAYFLAIGAKFNDKINEHMLQNKAKVLYDVCMFICAYITFIAMFSGVETLFVKIFDIKYTSVAWVVAAGFIAANGLRFMKGLNSVAVPVILLLTVVIFAYSDKAKASGAYNFFNGITYAAMNVMLSMGVMIRLGKTATKKSIWASGCVTAVVMATMLALITLVVKKSGGEMPVYAAADKVGLKYAAGAVILLSVFTTMVSALETAAEIIAPDEKKKTAGVIFVTLLSLPIQALFSFEDIVDYYYPVVSGMGILIVIVLSVFVIFKKRDGKIKKSVDF